MTASARPGPRRAPEVVSEVAFDEVVDGTDTVEVVRQRLRLPGDPPLAVERTVPRGGPTRPAVVLIHGFAQNRVTWRVNGRSFPAFLARHGFEVLNLELRGHGESRAYGAGNARAFAEYVDDAVRAVDTGSGPPFVVGHSLGGAVGIGVATERRLRGLVHLAGVYGFAEHNRVLRGLARATLAAEPAFQWAPLRVHTRWTGDLIARLYSVTDVLGYGAPIAGWSPGSIERGLLAERLVEGFDWTSVEVWLQMARWARGEPLAHAEAFRALDVPLLVVAGDADPLVRPDDARRCFAESGSRDKQLVVFGPFEHQVHWGHVDLILGRRAPEVVWPRLVDWMAARC